MGNKSVWPSRFSTHMPQRLTARQQRAFFDALDSDPEVRDAVSAIFGRPVGEMTQHEQTTAYQALFESGNAVAVERKPELPYTIERLKIERKKLKKRLRQINAVIEARSRLDLGGERAAAAVPRE